MKIIFAAWSILIILDIVSADCKLGEKKLLRSSCKSCICTKNEDGKIEWRCTRRSALCRRTTREVAIASDLKKTPCAADDFFHIDCNTCYCNSARTGYLCTEHTCPSGSNPENATGIPGTTTLPDHTEIRLETSTARFNETRTEDPFSSTTEENVTFSEISSSTHSTSTTNFTEND